MPDKKLTPMMELIEKYNSSDPKIEFLHFFRIHHLEYLEKERQMVIDSHEQAYIDMNLSFRAGERAEQYYTQNYKS